MKNTRWPGNWKVTCHVCGFWYPSSEISKRWDGLLVCKKDFEHRHPQTLIKIRGESSFPDFISTDGEDQFVFVCDIVSSQGRADIGVADCARADTSLDGIPDLSNPGGGIGIYVVADYVAREYVI